MSVYTLSQELVKLNKRLFTTLSGCYEFDNEISCLNTLMRLPICKIIYYLLKLAVIDYVSPKKECEIFFFYIDMRKKFCLCGGIVSCR